MSSAKSARVSERKRKKNAPLRTRAKTLITKSNRLIDQIRRFIRSQNKSYATEKTYIHWIKLIFHP